MSDAYVPMPDTHHPFYEDVAESVREHLRVNRWSVRVAHAPRLEAGWFATAQDKPLEPLAPTHFDLDLHKCIGPAPFVGDARFEDGFYEWVAAVDQLGRHVAGSSSLRIEPKPWLGLRHLGR